MFHKIFLYLKNFDWILFFPVLLLTAFGLIEIYSVSLGQGAEELIRFQKQLFFAGTGVILVFALSFLDYRMLRDLGNYFYVIGILLLVGVLIFGVTIKGTTGWFDFGIFGFQPVEAAKIILIIFLAKFFSSGHLTGYPWKQIIFSGLTTLILVILIFLQPDFGAAVMLFLVWLLMLAIAGFGKKYFLVIGLIGLIGLGGLWQFSFEQYQKERILTFINGPSQSTDEGYNISQAIIAVGAGGLTGRGIGFGSQSQLKFLPEAEHDFIFAVIAEELGLLGVFLLISFFAVFFYRCLANVSKIDNDFGVYLILGAIGLIFIEMFINISMNIGLVPVVGIPLPFVSYGGSALITKFILVGVIESVIIRSRMR